MKISHPYKVGALVVATVACLVTMAVPASATVHTHDISLESGRLSIGSVNFDTPGSWATGCTPPAVGGAEITGTVDDGSSTDNIAGTLTLTSLFNVPPFPPFFTGGNYALVATATATGTNAGNYNTTTDTFTGLAFTSFSFTFRNVSSCAPGTTVVCSGTASLTLSGGLFGGSSLPLAPSEVVYVNATGTVTSRNTPCTLPFSLIITTGTGVSLSDNPNDDYGCGGIPDGNTDPGSMFHQE